MVQELRTRLPMQGTQVRSLVQEDPTYREATKPVPPKPERLEPVLHKRGALLAQLEESPRTAMETPCSQKQTNDVFKEQAPSM